MAVSMCEGESARLQAFVVTLKCRALPHLFQKTLPWGQVGERDRPFKPQLVWFTHKWLRVGRIMQDRGPDARACSGLLNTKVYPSFVHPLRHM
jgi:hypothetical protein